MARFKAGDKLRCKSGFTTEEDSGGTGYVEGKTFIVDWASGHDVEDLTIYWPIRSGMGIYERAVELVVPKELPIFN